MKQPNVVLITVECWRGDHFGSLTPHLRRLADESCRFTQAQTPGGWTRLAMTALMSSAHASMHGGPEIAMASPARRALAECFLVNGYWTGGFSANPVCGSLTGFHRGFGEYVDAQREKPARLEIHADRKMDRELLLELGIAPRDLDQGVDACELTDLGIRWLAKRGGEPWFLWLHYLDPHWPCQMATPLSNPEELRQAWEDIDTFASRVIPASGAYDPGPKARERWIRRYRESLTFCDREVGRLLDDLRQRADWDRTIVAVAGDHGEEFFERGTWLHGWNQLHREGVEVPLIVRVPGLPPSQVSEAVGLIDLAPTLLDFAAIPQPQAMIGKSLRPLMEGCDHYHRRPVFTEMMGHPQSVVYRLAIRMGEWKYMYDLERPHESKLFRVSEDPDERVNLRDTAPEVFSRFEQMRLAHVTLGLTPRMERLPAQATAIGNKQLIGQEEIDRGAAAGTQRLPDEWRGDELMREQLEFLGYL